MNPLAAWRHELLDQRLGGGELTVKQYKQQRETPGDALPSPLGCDHELEPGSG